MAFSRGIPVGQQTLVFSPPQVQGTPADSKFFSQFADIFAVLHALYGIPLESHRVPFCAVVHFCRFFRHNTLHLMKVSNAGAVSKHGGTPLAADERRWTQIKTKAKQVVAPSDALAASRRPASARTGSAAPGSTGW